MSLNLFHSQVPACGLPHIPCYFLPGFLRKDLLVRWVWLRSHSFSQKSNDIHVLFPRSSWKCLFEQKRLSVQKLPPAQGWLGGIAAIKCSQEGRVEGKGHCCLFGVCAAGLRERLGGKGRRKRRSLNWWGAEPAFDSGEIKGYVFTFPLILLRSMEPLRDSAGYPGTTNYRIELSWLYLKLSL